MTTDQFVDYCYEFYGPVGLYPMPRLTRDDIVAATKTYIEVVGKKKFYGDSIDRENVRDLLIEKCGFKFPA